MSKKTIIVSGASGNLGSAVIKYFLDKGDNVIGIVHRQRDIQNENENYKEKVLDLSNESSVTECIEQISSDYGKIDAVILTAGGFAMGHISETDMGNINKMYKLNFETAYNIARPVLIQYKKQKSGRFFFIGSLAGMDIKKSKGVTAYGLSKSLLFNLAKLINVESIDTEISAQVVVPSIIDTPQNRSDMPNADFSKWEKPSEIAEIIGKYTEQNSDKLEIIIKEELGK